MMVKFKFWIFFVGIMLLISSKEVNCAKKSTTAVIGKLLAAFAKCGLKVGLIDPSKLNRILQLRHGLQKLDLKQIVFDVIDLIPAKKGYKIMKITVKCAIEITVRYTEIQAGIAKVGTLYIIEVIADIIDKASS